MSDIHRVNIAKLDVGTLTALEVLLTERSVSKAARRVSLSQPAMSNALARMRILFGDPLLVRAGNSMVLTARAEALLEQLQRLVPQLNLLGRSVLFDPEASHAVFKLAITDHAGLVLMPDVLKQIHEAAPHIRTQISAVSSRQDEMDDQEAMRFDLRVGWLKALPPHWHVKKLLKEDLVLIGAKDNPELADGLDLDAFLRLNHLALASDRPQFQNIIDQSLAKIGAKRNVVSTISHFTMVPFIVAKSNLVAMFPRRLASAYQALSNIKIVTPPILFEEFNVSMAWHPCFHHDLGHKWLRKLIAECAATIASSRRGLE